jgi:hypothetical protein
MYRKLVTDCADNAFHVALFVQNDIRFRSTREMLEWAFQQSEDLGVVAEYAIGALDCVSPAPSAQMIIHHLLQLWYNIVYNETRSQRSTRTEAARFEDSRRALVRSRVRDGGRGFQESAGLFHSARLALLRARESRPSKKQVQEACLRHLLNRVRVYENSERVISLLASETVNIDVDVHPYFNKTLHHERTRAHVLARAYLSDVADPARYYKNKLRSHNVEPDLPLLGTLTRHTFDSI